MMPGPMDAEVAAGVFVAADDVQADAALVDQQHADHA